MRTELSKSEDRWCKQTFGVSSNPATQNVAHHASAQSGPPQGHPSHTVVSSLHRLRPSALEDVGEYLVLISHVYCPKHGNCTSLDDQEKEKKDFINCRLKIGFWQM